ncbi:class I SAM-dependent methyltransferase [Leucobacter sp. UT-8R-CII-1-4]|uniref:class I SAM-dependent methyltransferase n=1 Tax=Leucobacter sp. UT-8R-CII-1-4 TaxID=3040075 RepID=UPI0024A88959|nr:class I SAM-dependent methyltransferase [Leucobacter sp. UT-8R-CII-1-4]MDI6024337.1 class I SAM-dependent methyltransferase [Leucobacter sp. UT-8R-CII-1-4]
MQFTTKLLESLRADIERAAYRVSDVRALLGASADDARLRGVFEPAVIVLAEREETQLALMIRALLLGETLSEAELDLAFPELRCAGLCELGLLAAKAEGFRLQFSLNPIELPDVDDATGGTSDWWILSDLDDQLRFGPARSDHVMGVGGATRSLLAQLPLGDVPDLPSQALDLGTGCGIVALYLSRAGVNKVVASDISERALELAAANAVLNRINGAVSFVRGDLFAPVTGQTFDLIASNPPFVITPRNTDENVERYEYRDGGLVGDELARRVVSEAPGFLADEGTLVCLANWESHWGQQGLHRVASWIEEAQQAHGALASWVIERDRLEPIRYAETWIRDGGTRPDHAEFSEMMRAWLGDFAERRVTSIGLGSIRIQKLRAVQQNAGSGHTSAPILRSEYAPEPFAQRQLGATIDRVFRNAIACSQMSDAEILDCFWIQAGSITETREHKPGVDAPFSIQLHTDRPLARVVQADPLLAAAVGACDGDLTLHQIAGALAQILELEAEACAEALVTGVRELVWLGMLETPQR